MKPHAHTHTRRKYLHLLSFDHFFERGGHLQLYNFIRREKCGVWWYLVRFCFVPGPLGTFWVSYVKRPFDVRP